MENRNLAAIRPSFIVKDLQTSIAYYRERLGFQLDFQGPDEGAFWAGVSRDGIGMDPDALFDEFSRRGASFVKTLSFVEAGLWGFAIADADGYRLLFYQLRDE
jgi:catechol 2,3-dioxygenase-like lactoylglutathione lyase family enzyme